MFYRVFPWAFFFSWFPCPKRLTLLGIRFTNEYTDFYESYKLAVIKQHKLQLLKLDFSFRGSEFGQEFIQSMKSMSSEVEKINNSGYPELDDVCGGI